MASTCNEQMNFTIKDVQLILCWVMHSCSTRSSKRLLVCKLQRWNSSNLTQVRIWHLPRSCHTCILHLTAHLPSILNSVVSRSASL